MAVCVGRGGLLFGEVGERRRAEREIEGGDLERLQEQEKRENGEKERGRRSEGQLSLLMSLLLILNNFGSL